MSGPVPPLMPITGRQYAIEAGEHAATIVEVGAGLRRYSHRGTDVTVGYGERDLPPRGCGAVLVPWPNRLRGGSYQLDGQKYQLALTEPALGNAIHGLARWVRWTPLAVSPASVTLGIDLVPQTGWTFEVHVEVTYSLDARAGLTVATLARNTGVMPAPFGAGFHPYLALHGRPIDEVALRVPARSRMVVDEALVPIGVKDVTGTDYDLRRLRRLRGRRFDDAFTDLARHDGLARIELSTRNGGATLWCDEAFDYVQVFTKPDLTGGVGGIAIEPMSCAADAFNSGTGLVVLDPGAQWEGRWGIQPDAGG